MVRVALSLSQSFSTNDRNPIFGCNIQIAFLHSFELKMLGAQQGLADNSEWTDLRMIFVRQLVVLAMVLEEKNREIIIPQDLFIFQMTGL